MKKEQPASPAAALAAKRWAGTTEEERKEHARKMHEARYGKRRKKKAKPE